MLFPINDPSVPICKKKGLDLMVAHVPSKSKENGLKWGCWFLSTEVPGPQSKHISEWLGDPPFCASVPLPVQHQQMA